MAQDELSYKEINSRVLHGAPELDRLAQGEWPKWYGRCVAALATFTDGSDVQFVDESITHTEDGYELSIRVFTEALLVSIAGTVTGDEQGHTLSVRPRSDLRSMNVSASVGAFGDIWPASAPGKVRCELRYDDETLNLPASRSARQQCHDELAALVPSLARDLTRR